MAKSSSSKYNRYEKQEGKSSKKKNNSTKSVEIEKLEDLDSTKNLDVSFIEGIRKKKGVEDKTEILDVEEINKANIEFKESLNLNSSLKVCSYLLLLFAFISVLLLVFIIYHFYNFNHKNGEVVEKEIIKEVKIVDDNYLFLGDSITEQYDLDDYYFDMPIVNSGVSGYTTSDIIDNLDKMVYQYNPSKVFLLIGTNDLAAEISSEKIIDNIREIIKSIKENRPYCEVYLQSIYPINAGDNSIIEDYVNDGNRNNEAIKDVNEKLVEVAMDEDVTYIDVYEKLLDDEENLNLEYTIDGLHFSDKGYEKITEILRNYIEE